MSHQLSVFLAHYGLLALFLLALVKGVGVPVPIPADLVVLVAATGSASGRFVPWQAFGLILVAMVVGGAVQFFLARGPGRQLLYKAGPVIGLTTKRLDLAFQRVQNVGVVGIAVAVVTPGIRTAAIPACGLTTIRWRVFLTGLSVGTTVYIAVQFFLAYGFVKLALRAWNGGDRFAIILIVLGISWGLIWIILRHRTLHLATLRGSVADEDRALRSHVCPLCWLTVAGDAVAGTHPRGSTTSTGPDGRPHGRSGEDRAVTAPVTLRSPEMRHRP
jgi:membrane protein DedA with SNARE-associated domain